MSTIF
jgi:hypothetical protein